MVLICQYCNKEFSSYQSRCNHTRKFHKNLKPEIRLTASQSVEKCQLLSTKLITCKKCKKEFNTRQAKWKHQNNCVDNSIDFEEKYELIKEDYEAIKKEFESMKSQFAMLLNKQAKIHPKTLQKINNQLVNSGQQVVNNGQVGVVGNNNVVHNTYVKFGPVDFEKVLTNKEILSILNKPFISLEESIKLIHFNDKLPEYNNVYITNMKDDLAYVFDGNKFISVKKNDVVANMIENYANEIELSFDNNKNKLKDNVSKRVKAFLDLINNDDKYVDVHNKSYSNFKAYKIGDIKRLIYDHSDPKKLAELNKLSLSCTVDYLF